MKLDAVVLSDLHLGSPACRAERLLAFLEDLPATRRLILNGDVVEHATCRLKKGHWKVLSRLRALADGLELVWVTGNHDRDAEMIAGLVGAGFAGEYSFPSGGKTFLALHGDAFDDFVTRRPITTWAADVVYGAMQRVSDRLAVAAKRSSKTFVGCCDRVRDGALALAGRRGVDAVMCGHTHHAEKHEDARGVYLNTGCWTEGCCTWVEVRDGEAFLREEGVVTTPRLALSPLAS